MTRPKPAVFVYDGPGAGVRSVETTLMSLRRDLSPHVEVRRTGQGGGAREAERRKARGEGTGNGAVQLEVWEGKSGRVRGP